jgi:predicted ATP-binding protein involved in virulence
MTLLKDGQEIIINQLSDGEKCLLALVGDLARRLSIANTGLENPLVYILPGSVW